MKYLAVDVKAGNFGFDGDVLVATDCDAMVQYDNPGKIDRPLVFTPQFAADEVKNGTGPITIQADVKAFALLIDYVVTHAAYETAVQKPSACP